MITVLDGGFSALRGDATLRPEPGEGVVVAPGVTHSSTNVGDEPGRVLVTLTPGGHEEFLRGLAATMGGPAGADPELGP